MELNIFNPVAPIQKREGEKAIYHCLKCWNSFFAESWGDWDTNSFVNTPSPKPFEIRRLDRDYREGDGIAIFEFYPEMKTFSGRCMIGTIHKILSYVPGVVADYAVLLIKFNAHIDNYKEGK